MSLLAVADTGTGIAPDDLEKVMEPFFTTKEVGKGTGLGLSMVYGFAKQSNGAFRIDSELGEGTRAELWLPRAPATRDRPQRPRAAEERRRRSRRGRCKILLVDDHAEVRTTTGAMLEDLGHSVVEAANGARRSSALQGRRVRLRPDDQRLCDAAFFGHRIPARSSRSLPGRAGADHHRLCRGHRIGDRPEGVEILLKPFTAKALEAAVSRVCAPAALAS